MQALRRKGKVWESGGMEERRIWAKKVRAFRGKERRVWARIIVLKQKVEGFLTRLKRATAYRIEMGL